MTTDIPSDIDHQPVIAYDTQYHNYGHLISTNSRDYIISVCVGVWLCVCSTLYIQGGPRKFTRPYLLKLLQVAQILVIILFQNEKVL